jgi:D-ornithine 4,5-aminomutase subunit alpha
MGFSSLETKPLVNRMLEKGILGHGAGNLVLKLAQRQGISVREAGLSLIDGKYWEELGK